MKYLSFFALILVVTFSFFGVFVSNAADSPDDITKTSFKIDLRPITPGSDSIAESGVAGSVGMANSLILQVTNLLLVVMGSLGLVTMTIGGGYMIFSMGNEENLGKGKGIFTSGLIAIALALSSYLIIAFVRYILYSNI